VTTQKPPKVQILKERTVNTYSDLWHGSGVLLQLSQEDPKGSYWLWMGSLILAAFSIEAYLNHIGPKIFASWHIFKKVVSPEGKLDIICKELNIKLPKDKRPRQTVRELFKFRNKLAHGMTIPIKEESFCDVNQHWYNYMGKKLLATWESYCTEENAKREREDIKQVVERIHESAKLTDDHLFSLGFSVATASLK